MKYRIGEMAEFFGLTKEAIRYYERKGIVASMRDERTGYRYYERDEITTLKQIRTYESLGFSLDEAQAMAAETTFGEMEERIDRKLSELEKKEAAIARMRQELERQQRDLCGFKTGRTELRMMPETYFWLRVPDEASAQTEAEREQIARERGEEKRWACRSAARCCCPSGSASLAMPRPNWGISRTSTAWFRGRTSTGTASAATSMRHFGLPIKRKTASAGACTSSICRFKRRICEACDGYREKRKRFRPLSRGIRGNMKSFLTEFDEKA